MSVMRFEIAQTLAAYFLIGWGTSLSITAITVAVNFSTNHYVKYGKTYCFIADNKGCVMLL